MSQVIQSHCSKANTKTPLPGGEYLLSGRTGLSGIHSHKVMPDLKQFDHGIQFSEIGGEAAAGLLVQQVNQFGYVARVINQTIGLLPADLGGGRQVWVGDRQDCRDNLPSISCQALESVEEIVIIDRHQA